MIDRHNFTPSSLILGVLKGMCKELYELYEKFPEKKSHIVASGGAVRNNRIVKLLIAEIFGMDASVGENQEEASMGVALFSAFCVGKIKYNNGFCEIR